MNKNKNTQPLEDSKEPKLKYKVSVNYPEKDYYTDDEQDAKNKFQTYIADYGDGVRMYEGEVPEDDTDPVDWEIIDSYDADDYEDAPDSKEGLHTQGEDFWLRLNEGTEDENTMTFGEYVRSCEELDKEFIDEILTIGHFAINEAKWIEHDFVRRISPPPNERKALLDSHRELKTAAHNALETLKALMFWDKTIAPHTIEELETALNNAKNI